MELLTKLEELILLSVWRLGSNAYGTAILRHIQTATNKKISLGGVYFPLDRLASGGFLRVCRAEAAQQQECRRLSRKYYRLTGRGIIALNDVKRINETMWEGYAPPVPPSF